MEELKVTKEKVLAAAEKCPTAKEVLEELFPEAFEDDKYPVKISIVGKKGYPTDNSYSFKIATGEPANLFGKSVWIISEPYNLFVKKSVDPKLHEFVTVFYEGMPYVVLNCFK